MHDPEYPRNARIRSWLAKSMPAPVITVHRKRRDAGRFRRLFSDLAGMWRASAGADVLVLAEFALPYALPARLLAWWRGARLVVDHFVGAYETVIGDFAEHPPGSLQARRHAMVDAIALRVADLALIDTRVRAETLRRRWPGTRVVSLPVGAPDWAGAIAEGRVGSLRRVLFYGNYLPLHGVEVITAAIGRLPAGELELIMVGSGPGRRAAEENLAAIPALPSRFLDTQPLGDLIDLITDSEVVLGVFGDSPKAASVIPNKVWQGLAARRTVITRDSPALVELAPMVGAQLIMVPPEPAALAAALRRVLDAPPRVWPVRSVALEAYVEKEFTALGEWLDELSGRPVPVPADGGRSVVRG